MEKLFPLFKLGIKYLYRYRKRYMFLLTALVIGFAVVTFITAAKDGMYRSVYFSAQSHYAGDIIALGYNHDFTPGQKHLAGDEISAILNAAIISEINPTYIVKRTIFNNFGIVFFNGIAVRLKYIVGSDWSAEEHLFRRKNFKETPAPYFCDDSIILSVPTARQLGARMGDMVILETENRWGQRNTGSFIIRGIVQDTSIFGYFKAYVSRLSLNRLLLYNDDDSSIVGFFLADPGRAEQKRINFQKALEELIQTGPLVHNRHEMAAEINREWEGTKVFLFTLPVYLSEIAELLSAMNLLTYFLYGMMLLIILVSAVVTYRLILNERVRELGVMRVIGFNGKDLSFVLWAEIIGLAFISLAAGFLLALILGKAVSFLSFSWFPGFEIFLRDGRLIPEYLPSTTLVNVISIFAILFFTALFPSIQVSRKKLRGLLSGEPI